MSAATAPTVPTGPAAVSIPWGTRLAGFGDLFRLAVRRDRILVPSSVLGLVVLAVGSAQATLALYPDDNSAANGLASVLSNPSVIALYGPISSPTADALAVFKTVMMGAFLTAVLGFVVVRRHTRTEEDEGRLELLGAGCRRPVGAPQRCRDPRDPRRRGSRACCPGPGWPRWGWTPPAASPSRSHGSRPGSRWSASRP